MTITDCHSEKKKKGIRGNKIVSKILFMVIGTTFSVKGACSGVAVSLSLIRCQRKRTKLGTTGQ